MDARRHVRSGRWSGDISSVYRDVASPHNKLSGNGAHDGRSTTVHSVFESCSESRQKGAKDTKFILKLPTSNRIKHRFPSQHFAE